MENLQKEKTEAVSSLVNSAKGEGFQLKQRQSGFAFIPIKDGQFMSELDYESLESDKKSEILNKISNLKKMAHKTLDFIKKLELDEIEKIRLLMKNCFINNINDIKSCYRKSFPEDMEAVNFLDAVCEEIEENVIINYSMNYEDDEDQINNIINKYSVNVIVDNSCNEKPPVVFEEDPNLSNLLGGIEYENKNGVYSTDVNFIKAGSLIRANEGCLILRANSLFSNALSYYYLKKALLFEKVDLDFNRGYLELLSLNGLKPEPVKIKEKIILIGDYETYDLLYNYDDDFKKIFKIRAECNPLVNVNEQSKRALLINTLSICKKNNLKPVTDNGIKELAKFLSRKAENRSKVFIDNYELKRILVLSNNEVEKQGRKKIERNDLYNTIFNEELFEKEMLQSYKENKILINLEGERVGEINALSVIDSGFASFGKVIKVTCSCYKGDGEIIDVHKISDLSGNIHSKSVNILKGYISSLIGGYNKVPVNFHLSFEQVYGKIDGDSASVAEVVSMLSSLSKIGIKQSIAVTGSINQFGQVQPIGGVNEKIEGFYKLCRVMNCIEGKGVLIPESNIDNLVLCRDVEEAVDKGYFHIFTMSNIDDALEVLMGDEKTTAKDILLQVNKESKKYSLKENKNK